MATTTTTKKPVEAEAETKANKTEELVKIRIPRSRENQEDVFVAVNGRTWLIKRGVDVEVPPCVVEVLRNQEDALTRAYDFMTSVEQQSN